jgi:hypothetical protein
MAFLNKKTGAKAAELRAYDSESEADAKRRLEAAGWDLSAPYTYDDSKKLFETKAIDTKQERKDAFPSEANGNGNGG